MDRLERSWRADADLVDIWVEIALDNPVAADRMMDRLKERAQILATWPKAGVSRPDLGREARALVEPPYLILYRESSEGVQIVRVVHSARDIDAGLFAEGLDTN